MNCPNCRRHLDYVNALSTPNAKKKDKKLTYYCAPCKALLVFTEISNIKELRGYAIMKIRNIKRASFYDLTSKSHSSRWV